MAKQSALTEPVYYILLSLLTPMHGYGIMQNVKKLTNGRVNIGAGTLYGAINTLLSKGFIAEHKSDPSKKEYIITEEGRAILSAELSRLKELVKNGEDIESGKKKIMAKSQLPEEFNVLKKRLGMFFNAKVQMTCSPKGKGKITIPFADEEELEHIMNVFDKLKE